MKNTKSVSVRIKDILESLQMVPADAFGVESAIEGFDEGISTGVLYEPLGFRRRPWWLLFMRRRRTYLCTITASADGSLAIIIWAGGNQEQDAALRLAKEVLRQGGFNSVILTQISSYVCKESFGSRWRKR